MKIQPKIDAIVAFGNRPVPTFLQWVTLLGALVYCGLLPATISLAIDEPDLTLRRTMFRFIGVAMLFVYFGLGTKRKKPETA